MLLLKSKEKPKYVTLRWARYFKYGQMMLALVEVFGEAIPYILPMDTLGVISRKANGDLSNIPHYARKWIMFRVTQSGFKEFLT